MHKLSSIISKPVFSLFEGLWVGTITDICLNNGKIAGFFVLSSDGSAKYITVIQTS